MEERHRLLARQEALDNIAAHADARGLCGRHGRLLVMPNAADEQGAHVCCGLGVTMKLHSGSPLGLNGTCGHAAFFPKNPE
jgi:hypothetical protein